VFSDVKIVGHENCVEHIRRAGENINQTVANFSRNLDEVRVQLKNLDPSTEEAQQLMLREQFLDRVHRGLSEGFTATPPTITFNDRLTLDLDDLTLKLIYFGRAHSDGDILIQVPEEELLLTGDLFLDIGWLPLFAGQPVLDIPRWIDVLSAVLDGEDEVTRVIPGHRKMWTREKFDMWREYIVDLWQGVNRAKAEGLTIEGVLDRFPLEEKYFYLKELGHTDDALERFQTRNVEAFWRQLFESAATIVEETLNESGIDAARQKFHELRSEGSDTVFFGENEFNALGYRLMGSGRIKEAVEIFKLNVEVYPNSWNVYDSLGEAYMNDGQRELAIENYRKSLELNPENSNGREMLKRLEGEE
jgi:glyoxylase-like metal-dependent hydrolase (beta-lactamase superfamily II)